MQSMATKKDYLLSMRERYKSAQDRSSKSHLINEIVEYLKLERKHVIKILNGKYYHTKYKHTRKKKPKYPYHLNVPLAQIWTVAGKPCSKNLKPQIPELIEKLEQFGEIQINGEDRELLCQIGFSKIDQLLKMARHKQSGKGISGTKTSPLLKNLIPIRTNFEDVKEVGHTEMDCVLHCGNTVAGIFAETLNVMDIHTHWNEQICILRKNRSKIVSAFHEIRQYFPFAIKSIDFDNGTEFVNWDLHGYCKTHNIDYTRSRSYHKNDQAHIEERNGHRIRRLIGYDRIVDQEIVDLVNDIYQNEYRLLNNFFYATRKLISKEKVDKKYKKMYGVAKTPYQRVLECKEVELGVKMKLVSQYKQLNPAELNRNLIKKMEHLRELLSVSKLNQATTPT